MKKFETGKRYYENSVAYEIVKRTEKTITYKKIQHAGRFNERVVKEATTKIYDWDTKEIFFDSDLTIESTNIL